MSSHYKSERFEARVTPERKRQFQYAANLLGRTITEFAISFLQEAAAKIIREHEIMTLSMRDQQDFVQALLHAEKPSHRLLKGKKNFDKKVIDKNK